jgi:hypothetical protein
VTAIYHITHVQNLPSIIREGGLHCDAGVDEQCGGHMNIGYPHLKARRLETPVPCGPGGVLGDYVPFYFASRSPMLYVISRGGVLGHEGGQEPVLHLVADAEAVAGAGLGYAFTDGHAAMAISAFFTDLRDLARVDWAVMRGRYWFDTQEDQDRERRRQAEFLVHRFLPWRLVQEIGVLTAAMRERVESLLPGEGHRPSVVVRPGWYY